MHVEIIVKIEGREAVAIQQELSLAKAMAFEAQTERLKDRLGRKWNQLHLVNPPTTVTACNKIKPFVQNLLTDAPLEKVSVPNAASSNLGKDPLKPMPSLEVRGGGTTRPPETRPPATLPRHP